MLIQETKISNRNITAFFFSTSKTKKFYNILSDIHGRKKQKHFGLFTFPSLCTKYTHRKIFNLKLKRLHQTHAIALIFSLHFQSKRIHYPAMKYQSLGLLLQSKSFKNANTTARILVLQNKTGPAEEHFIRFSEKESMGENLKSLSQSKESWSTRV